MYLRTYHDNELYLRTYIRRTDGMERVVSLVKDKVTTRTLPGISVHSVQ